MHVSWDMVHNRLNFLLLWTVFCPFTSLWTQKINIFKNWKQTWRYYHFTNVYYKWLSYDVWFLRYGVQRTNFFVIWTIICPFIPPPTPPPPPLTSWKIKILIPVYHKWKSYAVWFLRYQQHQTEFFLILDYFLAFNTPNKPKNENFEKTKKRPKK